MIICIPIDKTTLTVPSATSRSHCPGKTGYTQTSKNHCNVKKMFSWLFVNEGNPLLFLYLRGNNLEFGRECFCLLSTLRALNEIWFIRWSLRFFGDLATLYLTKENFHYILATRDGMDVSLTVTEPGLKENCRQGKFRSDKRRTGSHLKSGTGADNGRSIE